MSNNEEDERIGISIDEARKMLGIGRNLMLELVKLDGFPAVKFKRKIIVNKEMLPNWFTENCVLLNYLDFGRSDDEKNK